MIPHCVWPVIVYAFSQFNPTSGHWLSIIFGTPLSTTTRHLLPLSLFLVTMQSTQETKNSISSSVYGIQQLFRDFEKQCHILTTPATEGTLSTLYHHHHSTTPTCRSNQTTSIKKRSMHSVLSISTTHDKSSCSTLTLSDRYALNSRQRC